MKTPRISRRPNALTSSDRVETVIVSNKSAPNIGFHDCLPHSQTIKQQASEKQPTASSIGIWPMTGIFESTKRHSSPQAKAKNVMLTIAELETMRRGRGMKAEGIRFPQCLYVNKKMEMKQVQSMKKTIPVFPGEFKYKFASFTPVNNVKVADPD